MELKTSEDVIILLQSDILGYNMFLARFSNLNRLCIDLSAEWNYLPPNPSTPPGTCHCASHGFLATVMLFWAKGSSPLSQTNRMRKLEPDMIKSSRWRYCRNIREEQSLSQLMGHHSSLKLEASVMKWLSKLQNNELILKLWLCHSQY